LWVYCTVLQTSFMLSYGTFADVVGLILNTLVILTLSLVLATQ
jgi:hypothetical protein